MAGKTINRRQFSCIAAAAMASTLTSCQGKQNASSIGQNEEGQNEEGQQESRKSPRESFAFRYMLPSCMYGTMELGVILPEVKKVGATAIDIWPKVHGNQREQLASMGERKFSELLANHEVSIGCLTQYPLGPFGLKKEVELAGRLNCPMIVTGGAGPKGLTGESLKDAVKTFVKRLKPHLEHAQEHGVTIAIENHANNLIFSPDSLKWLVELTDGQNLGVAFAPYHLEQNSKAIADLIRSLGNRIAIFYAWQHGHGCSRKLPKEEELLQMPGRGELEFAPIVEALIDIEFNGWTEIFMHPVPRGIPILPTAGEVTTEINRARKYLDGLVQKSSKLAG